MVEIVERLRAYGGDDRRDYRHVAADHIEAQAAQIEALTKDRDALKHDNEMLTNGGIIEVAVRNFSVHEDKCACVLATERNTLGVRKGYELGGYVKERCPACESKAVGKPAMESYVDEAGSTVIHDGRPIDEGDDERLELAYAAATKALAGTSGDIGAGELERIVLAVLEVADAASVTSKLLEAATLAMEGIEVLDLLIASIEKHGNYSVDSTLGFLNQARCAKLRLSEAIAEAEGRS